VSKVDDISLQLDTENEGDRARIHLTGSSPPGHKMLPPRSSELQMPFLRSISEYDVSRTHYLGFGSTCIRRV
jgi:hypothetical protein